MTYKVDGKGIPYLEVTQTDYALISHPLLNKGMGFTEEERSTFKLHGLVPPYIATLEEQRERSYRTFLSKHSNLEKYVYLCDLQNSNETLFYNLITHHFEEMMPIIYTPGVGEGCLHFSRIYRRPRGLFLSYPHRHRMEELLSNSRFNEVKIIVATDGERVLGLGDQGAGGMAISIGKLSLYTACAGIHPSKTLPIFLDTGTDNPDLLNDPSYIGWRHERIRGKEYEEYMDLFVQAVKKRFPSVLLHWEDFAQINANQILTRYKNELLTFNDDIQGTAAVSVAALTAAVSQSGHPFSEQKIAIAGAGSAGCGIAHLLVKMMMKEGLSEDECLNRLFLIDKKGLLKENDSNLQDFQKPFAKKSADPSYSLEDVIEKIHPTILIGVSGQGGLFTEKLIKKMASFVKTPIIFPLSNPTSKSEASPYDLLTWTEGRAIISTGSPFSALTKNQFNKRVSQTNNAYIFPGLGLGALALEAKVLTDELFMEAAKALAEFSCPQNLLPPLNRIREVSFQIALRIAKKIAPQQQEEELVKKILPLMWDPIYLPYKKP